MLCDRCLYAPIIELRCFNIAPLEGPCWLIMIYGDPKTITVKAVYTCERHETTSPDNCDMVNDGSGNESSTAVELLWTDCLS